MPAVVPASVVLVTACSSDRDTPLQLDLALPPALAVRAVWVEHGAIFESGLSWTVDGSGFGTCGVR